MLIYSKTTNRESKTGILERTNDVARCKTSRLADKSSGTLSIRFLPDNYLLHSRVTCPQTFRGHRLFRMEIFAFIPNKEVPEWAKVMFWEVAVPSTESQLNFILLLKHAERNRSSEGRQRALCFLETPIRFANCCNNGTSRTITSIVVERRKERIRSFKFSTSFAVFRTL